MTAPDLQVVCPQCGATVTAPAGDAQCPWCGSECEVGDAIGASGRLRRLAWIPTTPSSGAGGPARATGFEASFERPTAALGHLEWLAAVDEQALRESVRVTPQAAAALGILTIGVRAEAGRGE